MSQKAINRRNHKRMAKRLRLQRAELRLGRKVPNAHYIHDPKASQTPGRNNDLKTDERIPGRFGAPRW